MNLTDNQKIKIAAACAILAVILTAVSALSGTKLQKGERRAESLQEKMLSETIYTSVSQHIQQFYHTKPAIRSILVRDSLWAMPSRFNDREVGVLEERLDSLLAESAIGGVATYDALAEEIESTTESLNAIRRGRRIWSGYVTDVIYTIKGSHMRDTLEVCLDKFGMNPYSRLDDNRVTQPDKRQTAERNKNDNRKEPAKVSGEHQTTDQDIDYAENYVDIPWDKVEHQFDMESGELVLRKVPDTPKLRKGQVIVLSKEFQIDNYEKGIECNPVRKIDGIKETQDRYLLKTSDGAMDDVFDSFSLHISLTDQDIEY